jgi:hypothetical protein
VRVTEAVQQILITIRSKKMLQIPFFEGLYEGRGVNPDTTEGFNLGIDYGKADSPTKSPAQTSILTMQTITSSSELSSALDIGVSASLSTIKGGGSAEAKFFRGQELNSYYVYGLLKVYVENESDVIRKVLLTETALKRLKDENWEGFSRIYGTHYVEGFVTGGIYFALIEVRTTSAQDKQEISAKISGQYRITGAKVDGGANATAKLQAATKNQSTSVYVFQAGGSGDVLETSLDEMIEQAMEFPALALKTPKRIRAILNKYDSVENIPSAVAIPPSAKSDALQDLGRLYLELRDYRKQLDFVLDNLDRFDEYKNLSKTEKQNQRKLFKAEREKVSKAMNNVSDSADKCIADSTKCQPPSDLNVTKIDLPEGALPSVLPTRINGTSITVPINSSPEKLQEYDIPNQDGFEVSVKLSIPLSETKSGGAARFIGLGISASKSGKTVSIKSGTTSNGRLLVAEASSDPNKTVYKSPGQVVYLTIKKQADEFSLLWSSDGLSFESLIKEKSTNLGFSEDDTYKVFLGGYSSDSKPISGKFSDLIIT